MSALPQAKPYSFIEHPYPQIAKKPCKRCGRAIRRAYDLDGNFVALEVAPTLSGTFVTIAAWTQHTVYVGEADAGESVPAAERFAKHVHA